MAEAFLLFKSAFRYNGEMNLEKDVSILQQQTIMSVGKRIPLNIKKLGINGEGIGYYKRNIVFVPGAITGEEVYIELTKVARGYSEGKIIKVQKRSKHRTTPPCPVYDECGGCQLQHMKYDMQLKAKRDIVAQSLAKYVKDGAKKIDLRPTIGMDDPWNYRNKSAFQARQSGDKVLAGLYAENSHKLLDIEDCAVQHPMTAKMTTKVKRIMQELQIPAYNEKTNRGTVRTIVVRTGVNTGETQIVFVTTKKNFDQKDELVERVKALDSKIVSIVQNVKEDSSPLIFGDQTIVLAGKESIREKLGEYAFDLSARAFFQLNPTQTVHLYNQIKKAAKLTGKESIVDAYCGVGTIGLWLSKGAKEIRGMDIIPESIVDAKKNAKKYGVENATYVQGTAEHWLEEWRLDGYVPDVVTVDPPRTGLDDSFIETMLVIRPERIVYTSCNPSTLAKDLAQLMELYQVEYIQPVYMFPQTAHVESVTLLTLKK